jgi:SAM-dependent methyltransferase
MSDIIDQNYLRNEQYHDSSNLTKRSGLHERFSTNPSGWFNWVAEQIEQPGPCRVLEIGCGSGLLWKSQGARLPQTWQVTLSDFSPGMVAQARAAQQGQTRAYQYAVNDAQALPFADSSFDILIANHMLYHVPDRPRALAEFQRVLRKGGLLAAATNGRQHLHELHVWIARAAGCKLEELDKLTWGTLGFNLENGAEQLAAFFGSIELRGYGDSLEVSEVGPLLDYTDSMYSSEKAIQFAATRERLRELWTEEIRLHQTVHISKDSGLFLARK